jgi:hypothetical protein
VIFHWLHLSNYPPTCLSANPKYSPPATPLCPRRWGYCSSHSVGVIASLLKVRHFLHWTAITYCKALTHSRDSFGEGRLCPLLLLSPTAVTGTAVSSEAREREGESHTHSVGLTNSREFELIIESHCFAGSGEGNASWSK